MKIIQPYAEFETPIYGSAGRNMVSLIERAARTCYKSEGKITNNSGPEFVRKICQVRKHASVIEHASVTVRFICDRGVSHELVRHRLAAYSQESTRYCNYAADRFGREITVIEPPFWSECDHRYQFWKEACEHAERLYFALLDYDATPQEARAVLPNSLKTEVVMTANLREWRHVLQLRCAEAAHPQMRQIMRVVLAEFRRWLPEIFDDIYPEMKGEPREASVVHDLKGAFEGKPAETQREEGGLQCPKCGLHTRQLFLTTWGQVCRSCKEGLA